MNYETGVSTIPDPDGKPHKLPEPFVLDVHMSASEELEASLR